MSPPSFIVKFVPYKTVTQQNQLQHCLRQLHANAWLLGVMLQFNISSLRVKIPAPAHVTVGHCSNLMTIPSNLVVVGWCQQVQCPLCAIMGDLNFSSVAVVLLSLCLMAGQGGGSTETHRAVITLGQITLGERAGSHPQDTLKTHIKAHAIYSSWEYM